MVSNSVDKDVCNVKNFCVFLFSPKKKYYNYQNKTLYMSCRSSKILYANFFLGVLYANFVNRTR